LRLKKIKVKRMKKEEIKEDVLYNLAAPTWMDMKED